MRETLTWEAAVQPPAAATAAGQKLLLALAFTLPVPAMAAGGMSLPLPDQAYRLATAAIERTASIVPGIKSRDEGRSAPTRRAEKPARKTPARGGDVTIRRSVATAPSRAGTAVPPVAAKRVAVSPSPKRTTIAPDEPLASSTATSTSRPSNTGNASGASSPAAETPRPVEPSTPAAAEPQRAADPPARDKDPVTTATVANTTVTATTSTTTTSVSVTTATNGRPAKDPATDPATGTTTGTATVTTDDEKAKVKTNASAGSEDTSVAVTVGRSGVGFAVGHTKKP